ncbi:MAG: cadmium-translocating P-type ATPase [Clostridia bacterium]|nr:cadmium-translocating P-type ATPase [Clostridia bacterium]
MKKTIKITGLDCAHCASELEEELSKVVGVTEVTVSFVDQKIYLEYETERALTEVKETANNFEEVKVVEDEQENSLKQENSDGWIVLRIENLHCVACALDLEDEIKKIQEVEDAQVDFVTQTIRLKASEVGVQKAIKKANKFEKVRVLDGGVYEPKGNKWNGELIRILISAGCFLLGMALGKFWDFLVLDVISYCLYAVAYFVVGYPVLISTFKNCAKGKIFDENFLMTIASVGAVCLGQYDEGVAVMLLYQTGEWLQGLAVGASRNSVAELMALKSERAYVLRGESYEEVAPETLRIGDTVLIKAGEKVPVDGTLLTENATLDTKSLTGESEPRALKKGEEVLSGCINQGGVFEIKVLREYEDSAVGKILDLVENATAKKATPEKFITKFAKYYTPIVCALALVIVLFAPPISGLISENRFFYKDLGRWVQTALTFLVISCPCALIISVPLTYFSGIGACAKKGILVKGATYLDELSRVKTVAFDKTGTLTQGDFSIRSVETNGKADEREVLALISAMEKNSAHPIAKAFWKVETDVKATEIEEVSGRGLKGKLDGEVTLVGGIDLLRENGIEVKEKESVYTLVYLAKNGDYLGVVEVGDQIRMDAKDSLNGLSALGIQRNVMLTGDRKNRAEKIANELGMYECFAELLPDEKLKKAEELKGDGGLAYVGDGINDAPVMKVADCAISMGKLGSAAAVEASDLVLVSDRLTGIVDSIKIAKKTRRIVVENIVFSVVMKVLFMALGAFGALPLALAVFADVGVMLLAVLNSLRMRISV